MSSVNKVILLGRVGKDPESKVVGSTNMSKTTLATSKSFRDKKGDKNEETEWHNITFFGKLSEVVDKFVKKGSQIYVEGEIKSRSYDDKDGIKRFYTEIICNSLTLLGSPRVDSSEIDNSNIVSNPVKEEDNDLPF